jgi:DNA-binding transcriptional LysR family regulator
MSHRLVDRKELTMADLAGESIMDTPSRRTSSVEEKFELIATGHGIALVPESVVAAYPRPDLVYLPVTDGVPAETFLVVAENRRDERLVDFLEIGAEALRA